MYDKDIHIFVLQCTELCILKSLHLESMSDYKSVWAVHIVLLPWHLKKRFDIQYAVSLILI